MPLEDPLQQFLAQPDNLPLALDIGRRVERLKVTLHKQFWPAITAELRERLAGSEYAERWNVVPPAARKRMSMWAGVYIKPTPDKEKVIVYPELSQTTPKGGFRLAYGVHWSKKYQENFGIEAVKVLTERLNLQGFRTREWWPGVKNLDIWLKREKFLLGMANEQEAFIKNTADSIWTVFVDNEAQLMAANEELGQIDA